VMTAFPLSTSGAMIAEENAHKAFNTKLKKAKPLERNSVDDDYEVPVLLHICDKREPTATRSHISISRIYSAVSDLNDAYAKQPGSNGDGNGVETPLRFELANKDDQGNPTTGINRVNGAERSAAYATHGIYHAQSPQGENESVVKNWSRQSNQHCY